MNDSDEALGRKIMAAAENSDLIKARPSSADFRVDILLGLKICIASCPFTLSRNVPHNCAPYTPSVHGYGSSARPDWSF